MSGWGEHGPKKKKGFAVSVVLFFVLSSGNHKIVQTFIVFDENEILLSLFWLFFLTLFAHWKNKNELLERYEKITNSDKQKPIPLNVEEWQTKELTKDKNNPNKVVQWETKCKNSQTFFALGHSFCFCHFWFTCQSPEVFHPIKFSDAFLGKK